MSIKPPLHYSLKINQDLEECHEALKLLSKPDLLRLVKRFSIVSKEFTSYLDITRLDSSSIFSNLSTLQNLRELRLDDLGLPWQMESEGTALPPIPTVQSLVLVRPNGSGREVLHFIGFFQNLQDFGLIEFYPRYDEDPLTHSLKLSLPPLRGWLAFKWGYLEEVEKLVQLMISLLPRFCPTGVDFSGANRQTYLRITEACGQTLKTCQVGETRKDFLE